jgi:hypothetical protein
VGCFRVPVYDDFANLSFDSVSVSPGVPELSTWAMMLLGFGALGFAGYRRARMGGGLALSAG